jgi:hypothetical protein
VKAIAAVLLLAAFASGTLAACSRQQQPKVEIPLAE